MKLRKTIAATLIAGLLSLSMPLAALADLSDNAVQARVRGTVVQQQADQWQAVSSEVPLGTWVRTDDASEVTLMLGGAVVRAASGTEFRVDSHQAVTLRHGRLMANVDEGSKLDVDASGSVVTSSGGEFVVDADGTQPKLHVFEGDARLIGQQHPFFSAVASWLTPQLVAQADPPGPYDNIIQQAPLHEMGEVIPVAGFNPVWGILAGGGLLGLIILLSADDASADIPPSVSN